MPRPLIIALNCVLTWFLVYLSSIALGIIFGVSTISGTKEFFRLYPVNAADHVFAVILTGTVTALGYCSVWVFHKGAVIKHSMAKTVVASCIIYIPIMFGLAHIMTIT